MMKNPGVFCSSNFRDMGKVMPVIFGELKMSFRVRKKAMQLAFSERQQQFVNSGNNISFPRILCSLKVQLAYPNRYIFLSV